MMRIVYSSRQFPDEPLTHGEGGYRTPTMRGRVGATTLRWQPMKRRDFNSVLIGGLATSAITRRPDKFVATPPDVRVNGDRINAHLTALAQFRKKPPGGNSPLPATD